MKGKLSNAFMITLFSLISSIYIIYVFDGFGYIFVFKKPKLLLPPTGEIPTKRIEIITSAVTAAPMQTKIRTKDIRVAFKPMSKNSLCPNLESQDFTLTYDILNSKVAIVIAVLSQKDYEDYLVAINTTQCYAKHFGYQMHLINMTDDPKIKELCNQTDVFFKRHCALTLFMEDHKDTIDYILYIDADMGVINPCNKIQDYLDVNEKVEIIFYERYYDQEVAAGSYLVRNSDYSRKFIRYWADYFYHLPQSFHGTDNGAIHQVLMELHFNDTQARMQCYDLWNNSKGYDDLFAYQACTKHAFGNGTLFVNNTVKLIRKMSPGWVRDGWLTQTKWSPNDFMFHGWKKSKLGGEWEWPFENPTFDMQQCIFGDSSFPNFKYLPKFVSNNSEIRNILEEKVKAVEIKYVELLKKAKLMCESGFEPRNGICPL